MSRRGFTLIECMCYMLVLGLFLWCGIYPLYTWYMQLDRRYNDCCLLRDMRAAAEVMLRDIAIADCWADRWPVMPSCVACRYRDGLCCMVWLEVVEGKLVRHERHVRVIDQMVCYRVTSLLACKVRACRVIRMYATDRRFIKGVRVVVELHNGSEHAWHATVLAGPVGERYA